MSREVSAFVDRLADVKVPAGLIFNPWSGYDPVYDVSEKAPEMRRENLIRFLDERRKTARVLLIGEAPGYQGGKFSGIAMMSERTLGGHRVGEFPRKGYHERTSKEGAPNIKQTEQLFGFNEPTASVVWGAVLENEIDPRSVVTWNIFPFHPHKKGNRLSNRTPTEEDILKLLFLYREFRLLFPKEVLVLAIGKKAGAQLALPSVQMLRHPANGGAEQFRKQLKEMRRRIAG